MPCSSSYVDTHGIIYLEELEHRYTVSIHIIPWCQSRTRKLKGKEQHAMHRVSKFVIFLRLVQYTRLQQLIITMVWRIKQKFICVLKAVWVRWQERNVGHKGVNDNWKHDLVPKNGSMNMEQTQSLLKGLIQDNVGYQNVWPNKLTIQQQ